MSFTSHQCQVQSQQRFLEDLLANLPQLGLCKAIGSWSSLSLPGLWLAQYISNKESCSKLSRRPYSRPLGFCTAGTSFSPAPMQGSSQRFHGIEEISGVQRNCREGDRWNRGFVTCR